MMQGVDLSLLAVINRKLGAQVDGGLSGFLMGKFDALWRTFRVDRIISMLTLAASIHNAAMLSRDLGETLVSTLDTILRAIQGWMPEFLKSPDGEDFDLEEMLKNKLENFLKDLLGADNYVNLKSSWIRANRILSTAANMLNAMRSMLNAITEGLETIANWVALGFNGFQREGLVSDRTWPWMSENNNFQVKQITRFTETIDNLEEAASSIEQLASQSIEFTSEAKELVEETANLKKLLSEEAEKTTKKEVEEGLKNIAPEVSADDTNPAE